MDNYPLRGIVAVLRAMRDRGFDLETDGVVWRLVDAGGHRQKVETRSCEAIYRRAALWLTAEAPAGECARYRLTARALADLSRLEPLTQEERNNFLAGLAPAPPVARAAAAGRKGSGASVRSGRR